jgi:basic membrane protein A
MEQKMAKRLSFCLVLLIISLVACTGNPSPPMPAPVSKAKVGVVIDSGSENDKSFNEYTLKGAKEAAEAAGLEFAYEGAPSITEYERSIENLISGGADLVITVGFRQGNATAIAARRHPEVTFAIMDNAYFPGLGCPEAVKDCYTEEGGLANVTSLMFAEDEVAYLAGVLAACVSETGTVATVAGMEIPPVVRFVTGFQNGAKSLRPEIMTLNQYIPDFNDPATGKVVAQEFISQEADVIFGVGGNTGNGGLLAAKEAGVMAIGVDVDQYFTYSEVKEVLITSALKNVDIAAATVVEDFAAGRLSPGIRTATLASGGVGLAPYHDWEAKIPAECKEAVRSAAEELKTNPGLTGANEPAASKE